MSKRNKISLGTPTEELPEWTLSLDFTESQDTIKEEKKQPESVVSTENTFSEPTSQPVQPAGSGLSSGLGGGLNTEFVIGNDSTTSENNSFSQPLPPQNNFAAENVLDLGEDITLASQDAEIITTLDVSEDRETTDNITTIEQPAPVVETIAPVEPEPQPAPAVEVQPEPVSETSSPVEPEPQPEPVVETVPEPQPAPAVEVQPEPVSETSSPVEPEPQPEPVVETVPEPQPAPAVEVQPEPVVSSTIESVSEPVDVDSQLSQMANSVVTEENEEQLLSAAADLIKNEQTSAEPEDIEIVDEMEHSTSENNTDVLDLLKQLDVSENIERMQMTTQEDIADVIEQTEATNELETAVPVEESTSVSNLEPAIEEPLQQELPASDSVPMESLDSLMPENTTESAEEPVMEITNDMFDMGYDLEDEPQYSEENIDLSAFKGSIKDADEINKPASDALDLDAAEAGSTSSLDMSNLVAAAMNTLTHHEEEKDLTTKDDEPAVVEETANDNSSAETTTESIQPDPSKLEKATLDFSENDDESPEANLDFGEEEDETLSNLDFVVEEEPEDANLDFNSDIDFDPDANLDFTGEEEENPEFNLDYKEDEDPFADVSSEPEITESTFETEADSAVQPESEQEPQPELEPDLRFETETEPDLKFEAEAPLEPDLKFESELQPEMKEEPQFDPEPQLEFQPEPQSEPEIADYQFEAEPEPALDFEADLDADRAIENLIPPMDDTLSHQLDKVITESQQGSMGMTSADETVVESPSISTESLKEDAEPDTDKPPVSSDTEPETPEPAQEEVPFTLHFEPVNPDQGSSFAEEMNDFDDVSSLIIEDYNEVPTVSSLEKDLKKQEKEKKKNRKKNAKKKKDEGFSLSLDEMGEKNAGETEEEKEKFKYSSSMPIRSTNMPEIPKPKEEPTKTETREPASQPAATSGSTEDAAKIQAVTPEMLAEARKEVEHFEDVHTHHDEKVYAEKNIYDNGTFQREYYQLYYQ